MIPEYILEIIFTKCTAYTVRNSSVVAEENQEETQDISGRICNRAASQVQFRYIIPWDSLLGMKLHKIYISVQNSKLHIVELYFTPDMKVIKSRKVIAEHFARM